MTRINQEVPDDLHLRAKLLATRKGVPLRQVVEDALREYVEREEAKEAEAERRRRRR